MEFYNILCRGEKNMHQKELSYNYKTRQYYSVRVNKQMIKDWREKHLS